MSRLPSLLLTEADKDTIILEQAALIEQLAGRIKELEALVGKPRKTSKNSSTPPSRDGPQRPNAAKRAPKKRPPRIGSGRRLAQTPDRTERVTASVCGHCGADVADRLQRVRARYDHIDLPPIRPVVTRVELMGGRCGCGHRFRADAPTGRPPGSPFGPGIRTLLMYLHHSHHVSFERLSRVMGELFGLKISEGAIANIFHRFTGALAAAREDIAAEIRKADVVASDETTTRIDGRTCWQWAFISDKAVLHTVAHRRAKAVAQEVMAGARPKVWVSDRYAGQQDLADAHQVCLAHVLRDVQYAIDCGDAVFAPKIRDHLLWCIRVGRRRETLQDTTLKAYASQAENRLDRLLAIPSAHPAGAVLKKQIKGWRTKFFVFMTDRRVPATNNISEREIRPSVVFRKVTNGFRSEWGAQIHAGYRSVTGTARLQGQTTLQAVRSLVEGSFAVS